MLSIRNKSVPHHNRSTVEGLRDVPRQTCRTISITAASLLVTANLWISDLTGQFAAAAEFKSQQQVTAQLTAALDSPSPTQLGEGTIHQPFDEVLQNHVSDGKVDYPAIADDARFADYIKQLQAEPPGITTREGRLVYWINAYNALAIKGILDGKSPSSLFGRYRYFKSDTYRVGGKEINLYDLERDILIPMGEPRIHFAIVCASASCPKLLSEAYTPEKLEQQLELNTRIFINDTSRNRFDRENKVAHLSKIFDWFEEDFEKHSGSVQRYVARHIEDPELAKELQNDAYKVKHLKYDWSLNGVPPKS